jgi:hypothetical protein
MEKLVRFFSVSARNVQENSRPRYNFLPQSVKEGLDEIEHWHGYRQMPHISNYSVHGTAFFGVAPMDCDALGEGEWCKVP